MDIEREIAMNSHDQEKQGRFQSFLELKLRESGADEAQMKRLLEKSDVDGSYKYPGTALCYSCWDSGYANGIFDG